MANFQLLASAPNRDQHYPLVRLFIRVAIVMVSRGKKLGGQLLIAFKTFQPAFMV